MYLYINTASGEKIALALLDEGGRVLKFRLMRTKYKQSEKLLVGIEKIIDRQLKSLKGIIVVKGPGSFTALRIGLTTANILAWSLSIPIVGLELNDNLSERELIVRGYRQVIKKKRFKIILPVYGQEPNITIKKQ